MNILPLSEASLQVAQICYSIKTNNLQKMVARSCLLVSKKIDPNFKKAMAVYEKGAKKHQ